MITQKYQRVASGRVPVVYRGIPLMPMRWKRAKQYIKNGRARLCKNKLGIIYLKLTKKPSGFDTQQMSIGIDPGSCFDGFSVVSKTEHNLNLELIHTKNISKRMTKRSVYRRLRRSRLWHRKSRFNNRTKSKLPPTIMSKVQFREQVLAALFGLFPNIRRVFLENVRFNHYKSKKGASFSLVEQGKKRLQKFIEEQLGTKVVLVPGYATKKVRSYLFCGTDLKINGLNNKGRPTFFAHGIDSFALACLGFKLKERQYCTLQIIFIERNYIVRRELCRLKKKVGDKKNYIRYGKGGKVVVFKHMSKKTTVRIKIDDSRSNHGPWQYLDLKPVETFHSFVSSYGGTISHGNARSNILNGISKRFSTSGWKNNNFKIVNK